MERVDIIQSTIRKVMDVYVEQLQQPNNDHIRFEKIIDDKGCHYQIIALGWEGKRRIFNLLFHLDIIENKVWVQEDKMENSIAEMLVEHGIAKKEIVLAYFPDFHRQNTEYAIG